MFMTNFLAILLAGGVVLLIVGLGKTAVSPGHARVRRGGLALFVVGVLLITIPLTLSAYQAVIHAAENKRAGSEVAQWLEGSSYRVVTVNVNDGVVIAGVEGAGELKPVQQLANQLAAALGHPVVVNLRMLPMQLGVSNNP